MPPGQQAHGVPQVPRCVSLKGLPPPATAHPGPRGVAFPAGVSAPPASHSRQRPRPVCSPLEVARDRDLAVHQRFHDPADHLIEGSRHVLGEPPLKALLHLLPEDSKRRAGALRPSARPPAPCPGQGQPHSLVHVERQGDVLVLGEEQDEEVVASLTLLDGGVQADLRGKDRPGSAPARAWRTSG